MKSRTPKFCSSPTASTQIDVAACPPSRRLLPRRGHGGPLPPLRHPHKWPPPAEARLPPVASCSLQPRAAREPGRATLPPPPRRAPAERERERERESRAEQQQPLAGSVGEAVAGAGSRRGTRQGARRATAPPAAAAPARIPAAFTARLLLLQATAARRAGPPAPVRRCPAMPRRPQSPPLCAPVPVPFAARAPRARARARARALLRAAAAAAGARGPAARSFFAGADEQQQRGVRGWRRWRARWRWAWSTWRGRRC